MGIIRLSLLGYKHLMIGIMRKGGSEGARRAVGGYI